MPPVKRKKDAGRKEPGSDDFFDAFEEEFESITGTFEEIRNRIFKEALGAEGGPFVYGFSMRIDPDGKPTIEEFGNIPRMLSGETSEPSEREPLTDVIVGEKEVLAVAELPGVEKNDIDLEATESSLEIVVETEKWSYHKKLKFPCIVTPGTARASYNNGVLEVRLKRRDKGKDRGAYQVKVG